MTEGKALLAAAALACTGSLLLFWPGVAMYDTVAQYGQVLAGSYDDWHPPAMARLWSLLAPLGPGAAPMLVLQLGLYWLGLGLIGAALGRRWGWAAVAVGGWPVFLGWQGVVLKDAQMAGALLAATGLVGWWRLRGNRLPIAAAAGAGALIAYATLVRANAVFATVPLVAMLVPGRASWRVAGAVIGLMAVLALAPFVAHRLFGAAPSGVERTEAIYDLAGIAVRVPPGSADAGLTAAEASAVAARRCSRAYFWDPLGEPSRCDATVERLREVPVGTLYATLARSALRHPLAYAAHRLGHLNSTERWLVPWRWPGAAPPIEAEPNDLGLASPGAAAGAWQRLAAALVETPLGWPVLWVVLAATGLALAGPGLAGERLVGRRLVGRGPLAAALFASALGTEASFAVLSIASDLRYHLWAMIATALGLVMLAAGGVRPGRVGRVGGAVLALVVVAGLAARMTLPLPPQTYAGMLG